MKNKDDLHRFLKYSGRKMSGKEMNAFERRLQKDAFDAEAAEGFSMITPGEAESDLNEIGRRLAVKRKRSTAFILTRVAAALILLVATSVIIKLVLNDDHRTLVSEAITTDKEKKTIVIPAAEGIQMPATEAAAGKTRERQKEALAEAEISPLKPDTFSVTGIIAANNNPVAEVSVRSEEMKAMDAVRAKAPATVRGIARQTVSSGIIEGTIISSEDNMPIPGVSVVVKGTTRGAVSDLNGRFSIDAGNDSVLKLVASFIGMESKEIAVKPDTEMLIAMNASQLALDEVVVVGYGISKKGEEEFQDQYAAPQPAGGYQEFRKYIEENIKYPQAVTERVKEVVVLSLDISSKGAIDTIRVVKSPGQAFTDEAIRLIREGPSWNPSTLEGTPQDDQIRVRIVFK